jgi:hypothetical protein
MRCHFLAATLAAVTFFPAQAQQVFGGPDPDRTSSTVIVSSDTSGILAAVNIDYSQPSWQESYDACWSSSRATTHGSARTGGPPWTTVGALEIGGTRIDAGSYYLGLEVGKDGAFSLLSFDSKQAMKTGLLPFYHRPLPRRRHGRDQGRR